MIGVDTNVLVRLFVNDDAEQHRKATAFFAARSREDPAFISTICAVEFIWVLTRVFRQSQAEALAMLRRVVMRQDAIVEQIAQVREAMQIALEGGGDFSDAMIALAAERQGATQIVTFDQAAAKHVPGMDLLA